MRNLLTIVTTQNSRSFELYVPRIKQMYMYYWNTLTGYSPFCDRIIFTKKMDELWKLTSFSLCSLFFISLSESKAQVSYSDYCLTVVYPSVRPSALRTGTLWGVLFYVNVPPVCTSVHLDVRQHFLVCKLEATFWNDCFQNCTYA